MSDAPTDAEFAAEYERIGYRPGERWPAPPCGMPNARVIELLRLVPSGAGVAGWQRVLRDHAAGSGSH